MSYTFLPHTADLRAEVAAGDLDALYQAAADLVRNAVFGDSPVSGEVIVVIDLAAGPEHERFFDFVRELVFQVDSQALVPGCATLEGDRVRLSGDRYDPGRHHLERQIKAVTRHGYRFDRGAETLRAELVFDL